MNLELILELIYFLVGISWFLSVIILRNQLLKNYSKMHKLKTFFGFSVKWRDEVLVWKELFSPSRKDKDYTLLINMTRITSLLVLIVVIYWIIGV